MSFILVLCYDDFYYANIISFIEVEIKIDQNSMHIAQILENF